MLLEQHSVIMTDHNMKLAGHFKNLARQCRVTNCYFQHCINCNENHERIHNEKNLFGDFKKSFFFIKYMCVCITKKSHSKLKLACYECQNTQRKV